MVSNSVEVELQGVCMRVYCINCVHNVFNSTCTVAGPNTYSKLLTYTEKELKLYSSFTLTVCACAKRVVHCVEKICAKKLEV